MYFSLLLATTLISFHWEATLISHLLSRKTIMPFTSITELYQHTNFRVVVLPNSADEDFFKYSTDPIIQKIYEERIRPYLQDYLNYPILSNSDTIPFIKNDFGAAAYSLYSVSMYVEEKFIIE